MNSAAFEQRIAGLVPAAAIRANEPLSRYTTLSVGGPADWLIDVQTVDQLTGVITAARREDVPVTLLGGGSNVVVSDEGIRGVVIRARLTGISMASASHVRAEAGVTINGLVRWTIGRGLAGVEAWAGTPGTVGGAIYGNAHYGGRNIGDMVTKVTVVTRSGELAAIPRADMAFGYDTSRLQQSREVLVSADFAMLPGKPDELRSVARASLAHRKLTQPLSLPSAGCLFQNPDPNRDRLPPGVPASAGALIDRAGLKGHRIGGAAISPLHANFVVNDTGGTARDIWQLAEAARTAVRERFGVELRHEVVFLGNF